MGCRTCSEIRCKVYGFVAGKKTQHKIIEACGVGSTCVIYNKNGTSFEMDFGATRATFKPFLKKLKIAFINRFKKA